jgi:hypothetical protein
MNKLYRFQYFSTDKSPSLHQVRDLVNFVELSTLLYNEGYLYEDSFLNYPNLSDKQAGLISFDENDLMVLTTRPPYTDTFQRRKIYRTDHIYEKQLLKQIGSDVCFTSLSRAVMFLHKKLAIQLKPGFENRASISFYIHSNKDNKSAGYKQISDYGLGSERNWKNWNSISKKQRSCAFLIFHKAKNLLPRMLYVFGMGGEEGLIFSRILRNGLWEKLKINFDGPSRFVMVEFDIEFPKTLPTNLNFINDLKYDVILDTEIPEINKKE